MKKISLALSSALFLASSSLATPLDEAIKDVDLSGEFRYRYDSAAGDFWNKRGFRDDTAAILDRQNHNWRAALGFDAAIADNFRAFIQFAYDASDGGYGGDPLGTGEAPQSSDTNSGFKVRQYYLTYTAEPVNTSLTAGKMQVDNIWTDNSIDGLVGTGAKLVNTSIDGLSLTAFVFDTFNAIDDGDVFMGGEDFVAGTTLLKSHLSGNLYGAAALGEFEFNNIGIAPQLWLSYLDNFALFYAFTLGISTNFFENAEWNLAFAYLGNSVDNDYTKYIFENNNFFALNGGLNFSGFDASIGGLYYGDKNSVTLTTLEDLGNLGDFLAGEEIWYSDGSKLYGDVGENTFGFVKAGYTFNEVLRVGADFVYGKTETGNSHANGDIKGAGEKFEAVARISYQYSPKLSFEAFYSYLNIDAKQDSVYKNSTRLQALYQF